MGSSLLTTASLRAEESSQTPANRTATEGLAAFEAGRFDEANDKLSRALDLADVPTIALYAARANANLQHWVKAIELYQLATRLNPTSTADVKQLHAQYEAERERDLLLKRIPRFTLATEGESSDVTALTLDGVSMPTGFIGVPQLVDPGEHELRAMRGGQPVITRFSIRAGEQRMLQLPLSASPQASTSLDGNATSDSAAGNEQADYAARLGLDDEGQPARRSEQPLAPKAQSDFEPLSTWRSVGWATVAVGSTGILLGAATGYLAMRKRDDISGNCNGTVCAMSARRDVDDYNSLRNWSSAGFVAGGIVAACGVGILLWTSHNGEESPQLAVGPASLRINGSF